VLLGNKSLARSAGTGPYAPVPGRAGQVRRISPAGTLLLLCLRLFRTSMTGYTEPFWYVTSRSDVSPTSPVTG